MDTYFAWIGASLLVMLSFVSGYKMIKQKTVTKNLLTLFIVTVLSTLILFGIRPEVLEFFGFKGQFSSVTDKEYLDSTNQILLSKSNVIFEIDPSNPDNWTSDSNFTFKWYNAPYGLAIDLGKMNMDNIKNKNISYQFLLIEGNDEEGKVEFQYRYNRLRDFLIYMQDHETPIMGNVEVKVLRDERFPSLSIYLFNKDGKKVSNFYIDPLINLGGKTHKAFQTFSESVVFFLDNEFENSWMIAEEIPLDSLLSN